ncbi:uncharacterized protein LOC123297666 isoform X2 [Chrysoperla carnea]|uniref:uncharacterized protein LOC123297666 isoform X2 n=1 Tax=Chrysoperla carnea TaxID=189513 RepID=UPI001D060178|nr:uncharacterized protein LOC123297666 isoform X2 [Chrysoperla carnea]
MRILLPLIYLTCLLWHTAIADDDKPSWSWGTKEEKKVEASTDQSEEKSEANPRSLSYSDILSDESEQLVYVQPEQLFNATEEAAANIVVDEILQSGRQGRHLKEYDEVYTDPTIQEALQKGDDVQARHLIKERLCSLGLMQCDSSDLDPKHGSYVSPDELIYAQPVAIKPVGEPIASIPLRGPPRAIYHPSKPHVPYGSAKPIPGPPRRGYGPPPPPSIYPNKPIYSSGSSSASFHGSSSNLYEGFVPPYKPHTEFTPDRPYKFEPPTKVSVNSPSGSASSDVQQHVHHHFHHGAGPDGKLPTVIVNNPVPVPSSPVTSAVEALQSINNGYKQQISSSTFDNGFTGSSSFSTLGSGSQSGVNTGYQGIYGNNNAKPIFENSGPQSFGNSGSNLYAGQTHSGFYGSGASSNSFGAASSNSFGASVGSFGNTAPFYKKELNVNKGYLNGNSLQPFNGGGYADKYQGFESARQENFDCVCVPINQCPSQDVLGRKEDFYLNIDPRNVKTDIQAEESITITDNNGTMTVVRVPKELSKDDQVAEDPKTDEVKKISKREAEKKTDKPDEKSNIEPRQAFYQPNQCGPRHVCCRTPQRPQVPLPGGNGNNKQCGSRHSKGINGRIKNPVYIDGDSEFGEYPWQAAILKKDSQESVYVCGGTLIDDLHILTAAHCVKTYSGFDLRVRLGEWDVNHDVEFYPYIERDVISVHVHPEFYAGTLYNDLAVLKLDKPVDWTRSPHISPACLPDPYTDYTGTRCWTTGWGKDAFGDFGKYQNILKEVDVPIINQQQCQQQLQNTRLGFDFKLHPGFICAGGEEGKDACKGDGGGPMVCERNGLFQVVGIVSWGIGCGQHGVPGVYVRVAHYLNWIKEITRQY